MTGVSVQVFRDTTRTDAKAASTYVQAGLPALTALDMLRPLPRLNHWETDLISRWFYSVCIIAIYAFTVGPLESRAALRRQPRHTNFEGAVTAFEAALTELRKKLR